MQRVGGHGVFFLGLCFCFLCGENQRNYGVLFFIFSVLRSKKKWSGEEDCGWWVELWICPNGSI